MSDLEYCREMIARELSRAREAPTPEAAESHRHLAMLYENQRRILEHAPLSQKICSDWDQGSPTS